MSTTSRNGTARRPDRPAGVTLNLDTLKREVTAEPFVAVIGGKAREFGDPSEMDWQELAAAATDPRLIFQLALDEDDYREVMATKIETWKVRTLAESYMRHYGFDPDLTAGNLSASPD